MVDGAEHAVVRRAHGRTMRKSCDRCHQQKLRCVGDKTSLTRCKRCQKAGLECVYGARSTRAADQYNINFDVCNILGSSDTWGDWTNASSEFNTMVGSESTQLSDIFSFSPISQPVVTDSMPAIADLPALELDSATQSSLSSNCYVNVLAESTQAVGNPQQSGVEQGTGHSGLASLICAFQKLESTFVEVVEEWAGRESLDCTLKLRCWCRMLGVY